MDVQPGDVADETRRLQRCINDLVSLFALPAMWSGGDPARILQTLLDALVRMLQLDLVYVRLSEWDGQTPVEMVRFARSQEQTAQAQTAQPHEIGAVFKPWLGTNPQYWPRLIRNPAGGGDISITPLVLGLQGEIGDLVAGSERADFPRQTERLILSVAANQASIGLQGARLLSAQKAQMKAREEADARLRELTRAEVGVLLDGLQAQVRTREEFHRVVVETASDAVVSIDHRGDILLANHAVTRTFGYEPSELIGQPLTILMPEYLRDLHKAGLRRYQESGHRHINWQGTELTGLRKNGEEFPVEISFGEVTSNGQQVFTGFLRDISERKQAEEALRTSERDLSLIIETIPGMVWCAAPDGELNHLNQRLLDYTGTSPEAWAQLGWKNLLHPDDAEPTAQAWSQAVATGQPLQVQCRLRSSDGACRWFQALGQAARDNAGKVTRWYGLLIDIDDRKNAEEALRRSQVRLSRAIQTATVGEFAAAVAHEVNQPLAAVVANGQACLRWLAAEPPGMAKAQEAAERIVRDGKEAGEVVRRVRALFKQAPIENAEIDLNEVIGEVLHLLAGEWVRKRVAVETDLGQDLAPVLGDRVQLQQVVFNLLLNGIEAMDTIVDRPKSLYICSKRLNPETISVEVRDSGTGLSEPDRVFDPFFTTKEKGMGMGLAICRSIIDAHRGRIWAASGEGTGATFSFTLPVRA